MTTEDLGNTLKEGSCIKRLFKIKENGFKIDKADSQKEEKEVKVMLKDMKRLGIKLMKMICCTEGQ